MVTETQFYEKILTWLSGLMVVSESDTHYHLRKKDDRGFFWEKPKRKAVAVCGAEINFDTLIAPENFGKSDGVMKKWCSHCKERED